MRSAAGLALTCLCATAIAQQGERNGVGYPTVTAALQGVKAKPGVVVSVQRDWTIVEDRAEHVIWSFAPASHAAYPVVVQRRMVQNGKDVSVEMSALCEAPRQACEALVAEFQQMNAIVKANVGGATEAWTPGTQQKDEAASLLARFHAAVDTQHYRDAYEMMTPGTQAMLSFDQFLATEVGVRAESGGPATRSIAKTTWYKDPPNAVGPGVFVAFDETCSASNLATCAEIVILHQPPGGPLQVMRYERTVQKKPR